MSLFNFYYERISEGVYMSKIKNYDILDLTKFILSIMVVAIHTSLFPKILYPWLRLAIPLFFIISSFLLFSKINNSPKEESGKIIKKFILRQVKLYLFWFVVLLPATIWFRRDWINVGGLVQSLYFIVKNTLFSSTFIGSWFITATITATFIIYKLSKKFNYKLLFVIFLIIYFVCCIVSNYSGYFEKIDFINTIYKIYSLILPSPVFSFPVALIWIFIGKMFADGHINIKINHKKIFLLILIIASGLLFMEWKFVVKITEILSNDCYVFLVPLSIIIFKLLLNIKINLKHNKLLRNMSTIVYPLHATVAQFVAILLRKYIYMNSTLIGILNFGITLFICYFACFIIFKLEKCDKLKILKYSH